MRTGLRVAQWKGALSLTNSPARQQTMRKLVHTELSSMCGAALKLGVAMLVFEGMLWLAALSAPAVPGAAVAVKASQTGKRVVVGLADCAPSLALQQWCGTAAPH